MSNLMSSRIATARTRVPHSTASVRARLSLVPARASSAPRAPFAVLIFGVLVAGVVGLLMFNTHMQQNAFRASSLQQTADRLEAQQQGLNMQLQHLRDPQRVAAAARDLGMVVPSSPAFLRLADGRVVGEPVPATPDGALFVRGFKAQKPAALRPPPRIVRVRAAITPNPAAAGRASADSTATAGKKKAARGATASAGN